MGHLNRSHGRRAKYISIGYVTSQILCEFLLPDHQSEAHCLAWSSAEAVQIISELLNSPGLKVLLAPAQAVEVLTQLRPNASTFSTTCLGATEVARHNGECKLLFQRLGHLPIAFSVSAALIREDVHYTIARLAAKLPADVTALIKEAIEALGVPSRTLLAAMAACAPEAAGGAIYGENTPMVSMSDTRIGKSIGETAKRIYVIFRWP